MVRGDYVLPSRLWVISGLLRRRPRVKRRLGCGVECVVFVTCPGLRLRLSQGRPTQPRRGHWWINKMEKGFGPRKYGSEQFLDKSGRGRVIFVEVRTVHGGSVEEDPDSLWFPSLRPSRPCKPYFCRRSDIGSDSV